MGKKITDYVNNVSVTPDELSLLDVSEKTGLATYESRKWTLQQFKAWINANLSIPSVDGTQGQIPLFVQDDVIGSNTRFTFIDNQGTEVGFRFSDSAGNLTQVGVTYLNVESQGIASNSALRLANWSDNSNKGIVTFRKSRGDKATPLKVLNEDILGTLIFTGQADKTIYDGFGYTTFPTGMTTAEIIIRAKSDYQRDYNALINETQAQALTQYEIWLQEQDSSCGGDFTPANIKVFSVDGNGLVSFKNYRFPTYDGTPNQVLKTDGAGNLSWTDQSGGLNGTLFSVPRFTNNNTLVDSGLNDNGSGMYNEYGTLEFTHSSGYFRVSSLVQTEESFLFNPGGNYVLQYQSDEARAVYLTYGGANPTGPGGILIYRQTPPVSGTTYWCFGHSVAKNIICVTTEQHATSGGFDNLGQYGQELRLGGVPNGSSIMNKTIILTQDNKLKVSNAYTLPNTDGTANQVLKTDGLGNVSWGSSSTGGVSGTGTANYLPLWTTSSQLGNSLIRQEQNCLYIGDTSDFVSKFYIGSQDEPTGLNVKVQQQDFTTAINFYSSGDYICNGIIGSVNSTGKSIGAKINSFSGGYDEAIGGQFKAEAPNYRAIGIISEAKNLGTGGSYCFQGIDGSEGVGKVLTCMNNEGMANWVDISSVTDYIPRMKGNEVFRGVTFQNNSTTITTYGGITNNLSGSQGANSVATTNYRTRQHTMRFEPSVVQTGQYCCMRSSAQLWSVTGGFYFVAEFGISDSNYSVGTHNFWGLCNSTSNLPIGTVSNSQPSVIPNIIAVANDSTDANLQIMHNDDIGNANKIDLGSAFPANRTSGSALTNMYLVEFYNAPSSTEVKYRVTNKETGNVAQGVLLSNLPNSTTLLAYQAGRSMGTTGGGISQTGRFDVSRLGVYSI